MPAGSGGQLLGHRLNSPLGIAAGPLLNSKWVEGYARLGFDVLTYATVRSVARTAHPLPNIRFVESSEQAAVVSKRPSINGATIAVSFGAPSMEPGVWRRDVRRAKDRIGEGQMLIVDVLGTPRPDGDAAALVDDYATCAAWAEESGADAVEVHLTARDPFAEQSQMIYENVLLAAHILHGVRTAVRVPVLARLGPFRSPRHLHDTATRLAPWASGYVLVPGVHRRVVDEKGQVAFEGSGRERVEIVGAETFPIASRQILEMLVWRKAGAWDRAILAVGGITSVERAQWILREGADVALIATAALFDPLLAVRFREAQAAAVA